MVENRLLMRFGRTIVGDVLIISLIGEIDISNVNLLDEQKLIVQKTGYKKVIFDLSQITYVDSRGIMTLKHIERFVSSEGGVSIVASPKGPLEKIIKILIPETDNWVFPDLFDAMEYLERTPIRT